MTVSELRKLLENYPQDAVVELPLEVCGWTGRCEYRSSNYSIHYAEDSKTLYVGDL